MTMASGQATLSEPDSSCASGSLGLDIRDDEPPDGGKTLERAQVLLMSPIDHSLKMFGFSRRNPFF
jgi:hypothetical protein